ncbi:MAG: DnaJ domain-containing protein [Desulfovibrionaceae bacterium]
MHVEEAYKILRLPAGADMDAVKKAFRGLAFELHPDLNQDNPHAARMFQRVNEAYVLLKSVLESNGGGNGAGAHKGYTRDGKTKEPPPGKAGTASRPPGDAGGASGPSAGPKAGTSASRPGAGSGSGARAQAKPKPPPRTTWRKEEVLQDILKDPFARQVFEDIYSQIRKSGGTVTAPVVKRRRMWGGTSSNVDLSQGVWGGAKSWMRHQLDDEQVVSLPGAALFPGSKIRLQVRQGWSGKTLSVEVTLPMDYSPGKPIRLKGLGRKIGSWTGDLYIRLTSR